MTIQEFLKKIPDDIRISVLDVCRPLPELVLDPRVWEALHKTEDWDDGYEYEPYSGYQPEWKYKMEALTWHLIGGGTIESYIETL